ncbi:hypothetical protein, partial [Bacteroides thetaiotaomicron]|uniref:hypothetical protein n=1 Tax=Bacteroides thetaiotaomicron TaxID=818 RepID=UPI001D073B2A
LPYLNQFSPQVQPSLPLGHSRGGIYYQYIFCALSSQQKPEQNPAIFSLLTGSSLAAARATLISCAKIEKTQENNNINPVEYVDSKI